MRGDQGNLYFDYLDNEKGQKIQQKIKKPKGQLPYQKILYINFDLIK